MSTPARHSLDTSEIEVMEVKPPRLRHIAIVLYEGFDLLGASVVANTLEAASEFSARSPVQWTYHITIVSAYDGYVASSAALLVLTEAFDAKRDYAFDAIFAIVGNDASVDPKFAPLTAWISSARARATDVRVIGLAPSRPDSQPRDRSGDCKTRSPAVHEALTGALKLVRRDLGDAMARRVAEHLSICSDEALKSIFADVVGSTPAEKVRVAAHWLQDNCRRAVTIEDAAQVAAMSERSLLRHFRNELGMTPSDYLMNARLQVVCALLIETDLPVDKVAKRAGMTSGDHLARSFRRHMKTSPSEYRAQRRLQC
jgi:transcriptional regulator GlxA family with amidase domain